jgi:hypothetical protein
MRRSTNPLVHACALMGTCRGAGAGSPTWTAKSSVHIGQRSETQRLTRKAGAGTITSRLESPHRCCRRRAEPFERALQAEGLDPDDPAVITAIDLVRWELSLGI